MDVWDYRFQRLRDLSDPALLQDYIIDKKCTYYAKILTLLRKVKTVVDMSILQMAFVHHQSFQSGIFKVLLCFCWLTESRKK